MKWLDRHLALTAFWAGWVKGEWLWARFGWGYFGWSKWRLRPVGSNVYRRAMNRYLEQTGLTRKAAKKQFKNDRRRLREYIEMQGIAKKND